MATLIPTTGTTSFDSAGKHRLAGRLAQMLSDDSLWHTVRVGPKQPVSCGRKGQAHFIIKLTTLRNETFAIADHMASAHQEGFAWGDIAVLCADSATMNLLRQRPDPTQAVAPRAQMQWRLQPRRRRHSGDNHEDQQRPGVPRSGATRRGAYACTRRGREGSGACVLCGGDKGNSKTTNYDMRNFSI